MYIRSLRINGLRCFKSVELHLRYPGEETNSSLHAPNVNLLLGDNGAGKSTILLAAALAALEPIMSRSAGYVPHRMIRQGSKLASVDAAVELHAQDRSSARRFSVSIRRRGDAEFIEPNARSQRFVEMFDDRSPAFLIVGYGATRRVEDAGTFSANEQLKRRLLRYQRVAGLFESHIALTPLHVWLPQLEKGNRGRHKQVVNLIDSLLPEDTAFDGRQEAGHNREYVFRSRGVEVPFSALSDGYRAYIGWVADLLYHVCMGCPSGAKLVENRGIVLVDEIDLHLHPAWQRIVISKLSQTLPNLQFVFSTHSPIVAGSVQKENVFVMELDRSGASQVRQFDERLYGLDAQQVLLSSYFGLSTTRAPGFIDEVQKLSRDLGPGRSDIALRIMHRFSGQDNGETAHPGARVAGVARKRKSS